VIWAWVALFVVSNVPFWLIVWGMWIRRRMNRELAKVEAWSRRTHKIGPEDPADPW
jgi:hypothetical protein